MRKTIISSLFACLLVFLIGTISAYAITIDSDWYLDEHFNKELNKSISNLSSTPAVGIRKGTDPVQTYGTGSLMMGYPDDTTKAVSVRTNTNNHSGTAASNYGCIQFMYSTGTGLGRIASTYFYGNISNYPTGSAVMSYGYDADKSQEEYIYAYNGARFYEQSFYFRSSPSGSSATAVIEFKPCLTLASAPDTELNPDELAFKIDSGNNVYVGTDLKQSGFERGNWYQLKYVYDFVENEVSLYFNGTKISAYAPTDDIRSVKRIDVPVSKNENVFVDDFISDPHNGRALTPFFTDFYIDDLKVQSPAAGNAKAVVKLYKGIPDEYVVIGAKYDSAGKLTYIAVQDGDDKDAVDMSLTFDFGGVSDTDVLLITAWNNLQDMTPLIPANVLTEQQAPEPAQGLDGLELHTTKVYDSFTNQGNHYDRPSADEVLNDYKASPQYGKHPRLMLTEDIADALRSDVTNSGSPKYELYAGLIDKANTFRTQLTSNPNSLLFTYTKCYEERMPGANSSGNAADQFKDRIMTLAFAYQMTGDTTYANAAWVMLERVMSFPDINPWHDLDFGFFCQGYAIAYDWMYDAWTPARREALEQAILRQCFRPANDSYTNNSLSPSQTSDNGVVRGVFTANNHNPIVNAGVTMAALALMDRYPAITPSLCHDAFICLEKDLNMFNPYGATSEGTEYMLLSADNISMMFSSLDTALGNLYGMDTCPGLAGGKLMRVIYGMESDAGPFSFGDTSDGFLTYPGELWFDKHYNMQGFRTAVFNRLTDTTDNTYKVKTLCWYVPEEGSPAITLDKDMTVGAGTDFMSSFATFRSGFDTNQTFVGVKAGRTARDYFVHLDQGSFVYHALGTKWAVDMGRDNYNLSGYMKPTASDNNRWKIFRLRPDGHNTLLINPNTSDFGYAFKKTASLTTQSSVAEAKAVVDMTNLYGTTKVSSAKRGFLLTDNRRSLVVRDEVALKQSSDLYWIMYIPSGITVSIDGSSATLTKNAGTKVKLDFASSAAGSLYTESAAPWSLAPTVSGQANNNGYKRIVYKITGATGSVNITAKLTPVMAATSSAPGVSTYGSIDSWSIN